MRTPFDIAKDILFTKELDRISPCDECNLYIISKYISYHSPQFCDILNQTYNIYAKCLNKQQAVDLLKTIFPKTPIKRIDWISRKKEKIEKDNNIIAYLAKNMELSVKEIRSMIGLFPNLLDDFDDNENIYKKME